MMQFPAPMRNPQQPGAILYPQIAQNKPISSKAAPQTRNRTSIQIVGMPPLGVYEHGNALKLYSVGNHLAYMNLKRPQN